MSAQLDERTPEQIKQDILDRMPDSLDTREGSFLSDMIGPLAMEIWKDKESRRAMEDMFYVSENSGPYLDKAAVMFGLARKPGAKAQALLTCIGQNGVVIPAGKVFLAGNLEFIVLEQTIIAEGQAQVLVEAAQAGRQYNVEAGAIGQQYENLAGLTAVVSPAAAGGIDPETDQALYQRYREALQNPATSGNKAHYRQWALEVDGVGHVAVLPQMEGPGTVGVILADAEGKPVSRQTVQLCAQHIEQARPVGAQVIVQSAQGLEIDISAALYLESSAILEQVQQAFLEALSRYFGQSAFSKRQLVYHRIAFMLLDIPGVIDYRQLTVCGGQQDILIGETQTAVVGEVELSLAVD